MNKDEKIAEAYGKYYVELSPYMNENGWCYDGCFMGQFPNNEIEFEDIHHPLTSSWNRSWRHISLKGIENNNGWIKIESEADLPKEDGMYWTIAKFNEVCANTWGMLGKQEFTFDNGVVTHYQKIIKPIAPIY